MHREQIDLSEMAKKVAAELEQATPENRCSFRISEGITANGDAGLWRIVLDNLIGNAWKYTLNREETIIEFGMTEREGKPVCYIRDNGPGFDMADAEKLFIPFQRLNETAIEGDGIGLATVQRIILRHGGRVWAESGPGMGATFLFTLEEP
jgi:light-regulated signal transduction histidine kinase (bacteriophytochrome)